MAELGAHSGGNLLPEIRRVSPYGPCLFRFCRPQDACGLAFGEEAWVGFELVIGREVAGLHPGSICRVESDASEEFPIATVGCQGAGTGTSSGYVPSPTDATVIVRPLRAPTICTRCPATRFSAAGSPSRR